MKTLRKIKNFVKRLLLTIKSLPILHELGCIPICSDGDIVFRGYRSTDYPQVSRIYFDLNKRAPFPFSKRVLYKFVGSKLMLLAVHETKGRDNIVGMNMYYLNNRDIREGTIHEGFIGVSSMMHGQGIATKLRKLALKHFANNGFEGVSSRISVSNKASLSSAEKLGFELIEKYYDQVIGEERYYLICHLEQYK